MGAITYIKKDDKSFSRQLTAFAEAIDDYATLYGLTVEETDSVKADAKFLAYVLNNLDNVNSFKKSLTSLKKTSRRGYKNVNVESLYPELIDLGTPPPAVKPNIQARFSELTKRIKVNKKYTKGDGIKLGIEAIHSHFDLEEGQPKLTVKLDGGYPVIKYKKGKYAGIQLWKDEGNGFFLLATANQNKYIDKSALPKDAKSALWKYRAIYIFKDKQVGKWSLETFFTVVGLLR